MTRNLIISLDNVHLHGYHGVDEQERIVGAEYELNVSVALPVTEGCATDEIGDTLSYADIYDVVRDEFSRSSRLIEHVATRVGNALLEAFGQIESVEIKVVKLSPPIPGFSGSASVRLFFKKKQSENLAE